MRYRGLQKRANNQGNKTVKGAKTTKALADLDLLLFFSKDELIGPAWGLDRCTMKAVLLY